MATKRQGSRSKVIRPSFEDDVSSDIDLDHSGSETEKSRDDEMAEISFGALKAAQQQLEREDGSEIRSGKARKTQGGRSGAVPSDRHNRRSSHSESDDADSYASDSLGISSDEDSSDEDSEGENISRRKLDGKKKRSKHAPSEASAKKPVSKIRDIEGLQLRKAARDIRFDPALGKADPNKIRKDYAFLDEYRQHELKEMQNLLKTGKHLSPRDRAEIERRHQALKSKMETLRHRDLEHQVEAEYRRQQFANLKAGKQNSPYFLKKSEKRKLIQKAKFEKMKPRQREKVMERRRKKRLGKELRQLENPRPQS